MQSIMGLKLFHISKNGHQHSALYVSCLLGYLALEHDEGNRAHNKIYTQSIEILREISSTMVMTPSGERKENIHHDS